MPVSNILKQLTMLAGLLTPALAHAQGGPGTVERTIPVFEPKPMKQQPGVAASVAAPEASARIGQKFILGSVNIEGATVFTVEELASLFEPYLASEVGQAELDRIVAAITQRYRDSGYLLSYAVLPEQSVRSGIVRVRIVEGYVGDVRLEGDRRAAASVRRIFEEMAKQQPLRRAALERSIGLARAMPGVAISDVRIGRSAADPERHQLTVSLGSSRLAALAYMDNRGTVEGARLRAYSSFSVASLAVPGDQLQVDLFAIPQSNFRYYYGQVKGSVPLNANGLRLSASASFGDQHQHMTGPDQLGDSRQFTGEISYPFANRQSLSLLGFVSLADWKSEQRQAGAPTQRDRLQVARIGIDFARGSAVRMGGRLQVSRGLDLGAATRTGDPLASRPDGRSRFTKFNIDWNLSTALSERLRFRIDAAGQFSTRSLLAPEEFALGGSRIGRAFDFNELTGDHGVGGMAELAVQLGDLKSGPKAVEVLAFVDGGGTFRRHASPGLPDEQWLASAGVGTRFSLLGFAWSGEVGIPIVRSDANRDIRLFVSTTKPF